MKHEALEAAVQELALLPGLRGCAIVEAASGLVWCARGELADSGALWEAAVDYWRLHARNQTHFAPLGALRAAVMYHKDAILAVFRCATQPELLLVAAGSYETVDWKLLQRMTRVVGQALSPVAAN